MSPSYQDLLAAAREVIPEVEPSDVAPRVEAGDGPLIIDVRETGEWDQGHLPGAVHIPRGFLESRIGGVAVDPERELLISCASGQRSLLAAVTLRDMGFTNVANLAGGFARWKQNNYPVEVPRILTPAQRSRYSRHILIPEARPCSSAPVAWGRRRPTTWPPPGWAPSGWWTTTWWTRATCSARSSTPPTAWA